MDMRMRGSQKYFLNSSRSVEMNK